MKYSEFIDLYAGLDENEIILYEEQYLPKSRNKEELMGYTQKVREEGVILTLHRQLTLKFKTVPGWAEELLNSAGKRDLEEWTDRILTANAIEEVFGRNGERK